MRESFVAKIVSGVLLVTFSYSSLVWGQQAQPLSYSPKTAIDQSHSRAEQEADQMVSLSADKILSVLTQEPGLVLEVKKALVRKAFEQGRVLSSEELTDDALYRLIREDENARIVATQEIEARSYIRAKPTRDQLAQNMPCRQPVPTTSAALDAQAKQQQQNLSQVQGLPHVPTQEELYWAKHEDDWDCYTTQYLPFGASQTLGGQLQGTQGSQPQQGQSPNNLNQLPQQPYWQTGYPRQGYPQGYPQQGYPPQGYPQQPYSPYQNPQQQTSPLDYRRQLDLTRMQMPSQGYFGMSNDQNQMTVQSGLPSLLSTSQGSMSSGLSNASLPSGFGGMSSGLSSMASAMGSGGSLGSFLGGLQGQNNLSNMFPEQARLENQSPVQLQPYFYPKPDLQPSYQYHVNPYADIPSLYDLYAQYQRYSPTLDRFGMDVFINGTGNLDELPMDLPVGPDYVIGPGDGLNIELSGAVSERLQRVVDREGRVELPEFGSLEISGRSIGDVQHMVQTALRSQFREVHADISLARLRTVRVYIVGDVQQPGAYDVSSLSTPLNALYTAGGPTTQGSMRVLKHYRGQQLVEDIDVYDLLLHGVRANMQRLLPGDTILVPPLSGQVTVEGMVRRPAIYELNGETNLAQVLQLAGGVLPTGTLRHVDVERVEDHESRTMLRLDVPETNNDSQVAKALEDFTIKDGDKVKITPILPYADKTVFLDGHVSRPGKFAYQAGMKVTDLIKSYRDVLPEPATHAEVIRLSQDFKPEVMAFNLNDALAGKLDVALKPFDTVRIFSRYDFEDPPVITVTGEVRDPGDHLTNGAPHVRDAVYLAGGTTRDALLDDVEIYRKTSDNKFTILSVNLAKALAGDDKDNILLEPKDRVIIHRDLNKADPAMVTIEGEVGRPGKYPLGDDMTAATLVRAAGGLKRGAFTQEADLTSYDVENGSKIVSDHRAVNIAEALTGNPESDVRLHDGDVLTIREISGWRDLGATIEVKGEVAHPGGYGIQPGERLSSILARAGSFTQNAYPYGAVFERLEVKELEEKNRANLIERVEAEASQIKSVPGMDQDQQYQMKAAVLQYQQTIKDLQDTPPVGRLVIHISSNLKQWANTSADIQVRAGDVIYIPKKPNTVMISGQVYNPTAITYKAGHNAGWYLRQAGGPTDMADRRSVYVIRADGSVSGGRGGMFSGGAESAELRPGDTVVVPERLYAYGTKFKTFLQAAQLASSVSFVAFYATKF